MAQTLSESTPISTEDRPYRCGKCSQQLPASALIKLRAHGGASRQSTLPPERWHLHENRRCGPVFWDNHPQH